MEMAHLHYLMGFSEGTLALCTGYHLLILMLALITCVDPKKVKSNLNIVQVESFMGVKRDAITSLAHLYPKMTNSHGELWPS
jgi:hypothetical protein